MRVKRLLQNAGLAALWLGCAAPALAKPRHPATQHQDSADAAKLKKERAAAAAAIKAHQAAEAAAAAHQKAVEQKAAALAQQQVQAAAALRGLEDQTSKDANQLAMLTAAQNAAAARLDQAQAALKALLPVMQRLSAAPATTLLAAPQSPVDSVRGIAILQGLAQEVSDQARAVKTETATLTSAITQAQAAREALDAAVAAQQAAEAKLSMDIDQARQDEQDAADQKVAEAAAAAKAKHELTDLDQAIANLVPKTPAPATPVNLPSGGAGAPVAGHVIQPYGAATVAGPATGISYAAAPGARVTSPCNGTILYGGPLSGYGQVVIVDCGASLSAVLAGMSHLDVSQGQRIAHGQPLGSMQPFSASDPTRQPRLYVELRRGGQPVDPTAWLAAGHSG